MLSILIFLGPPGSGKGTQASDFAEQYEYLHFSTGDMLRVNVERKTPIGIEAENYMKRGDLVPDSLILNMLSSMFSNASGEKIILDGFPRTINQAIELDRLLKENSFEIDKVVFFNASESVIIERLTGRGRSDDAPDLILNRIKVYEELTKPVLEFYDKRDLVIKINAEKSRTDVFHDISKASKIILLG